MRLIALDQIGSTNLEAQRLIAAGAVADWTMIRAGEQIAGRGRHARAWSSPPGNLYASFIVPKDDRIEWQRPWLAGFAVALALYDTLQLFLPAYAAMTIKWPNDVVVKGAKIAGILIEASGHAPFLVIGTGVNLVSHPSDTPYPATHLALHANPCPSPERCGQVLAEALQRRFAQWLDQGFDTLRADYRALSHRPGDPLTIRRDGNTPLHGSFIDIAADGCLLLGVDGQSIRLSAGDVFPGLTPPG